MQHVPLPHYEPTEGMRSANIQVKGLVRAGELVNHSTIVIAGFRVYTPLAKHRLPFDGCVCAHYVPFAGVRNHSGTARTSVCSELRKVMDYGVIVESRRGILSTFSITTWNRWLVCPFAPRGLHYGDSWLDFIMYALTVGVRSGGDDRKQFALRTLSCEGRSSWNFCKISRTSWYIDLDRVRNLFEKLDETKWLL